MTYHVNLSKTAINDTNTDTNTVMITDAITDMESSISKPGELSLRA